MMKVLGHIESADLSSPLLYFLVIILSLVTFSVCIMSRVSDRQAKSSGKSLYIQIKHSRKQLYCLTYFVSLGSHYLLL
jgi:hypothetical protein